MEAQNNQVHLAEGDGQHGPARGSGARFAKHVAAEVFLVAFCILTLPLWLPFFLCLLACDWWASVQYGWECMESNRKHDEEWAAKKRASAPFCEKACYGCTPCRDAPCPECRGEGE